MKAEVKDGKLYYKKMLATKEIPLEEIVWAYLQKESASSRMCCGSFDFEITRVIVQTRDGVISQVQYEQDAPARALLKALEENGPHIAIGCTEENKRKFAPA